MDEETRRELKEIEEESEEKRAFIEESPLEKTEELIKDLIEEPEQKPQLIDRKSKNFKILIYIFLFSLLFISLTLGFLILWNLFKVSTKRQAKSSFISETSGIIKEEKERTEKVGEPLLNKTQLSPTNQRVEKKYDYYIKISNLLFLTNNDTFVKVDVFLYFENYESYQKALGREFELRRFFNQELKRVSKTLWLREAKLKDFEENLKERLKGEVLELQPAKIELEGVLLRT
ncbi:MAG: hypothetical protein N2327_06730 [Caldimicrobium sp.]|nr:hypothetical protein [Caldimicrobium sp.]MCX7874107.1 hypothetical protein [Caldimicrobium sp.]MDW8093758.1 hypothetical protein [Caldimicrobium sp.]